MKENQSLESLKNFKNHQEFNTHAQEKRKNVLIVNLILNELERNDKESKLLKETRNSVVEFYDRPRPERTKYI